MQSYYFSQCGNATGGENTEYDSWKPWDLLDVSQNGTADGII